MVEEGAIHELSRGKKEEDDARTESQTPSLSSKSPVTAEDPKSREANSCVFQPSSSSSEQQQLFAAAYAAQMANLLGGANGNAIPHMASAPAPTMPVEMAQLFQMYMQQAQRNNPAATPPSAQMPPGNLPNPSLIPRLPLPNFPPAFPVSGGAGTPFPFNIPPFPLRLEDDGIQDNPTLELEDKHL